MNCRGVVDRGLVQLFHLFSLLSDYARVAIVYSLPSMLVTYTADQLRAFNRDVDVSMPVRQAIFSLSLWQPLRQSKHRQDQLRRQPIVVSLKGLFHLDSSNFQLKYSTLTTILMSIINFKSVQYLSNVLINTRIAARSSRDLNEICGRSCIWSSILNHDGLLLTTKILVSRVHGEVSQSQCLSQTGFGDSSSTF